MMAHRLGCRRSAGQPPAQDPSPQPFFSLCSLARRPPPSRTHTPRPLHANLPTQAQPPARPSTRRADARARSTAPYRRAEKEQAPARLRAVTRSLSLALLSPPSCPLSHSLKKNCPLTPPLPTPPRPSNHGREVGAARPRALGGPLGRGSRRGGRGRGRRGRRGERTKRALRVVRERGSLSLCLPPLTPRTRRSGDP